MMVHIMGLAGFGKITYVDLCCFCRHAEISNTRKCALCKKLCTDTCELFEAAEPIAFRVDDLLHTFDYMTVDTIRDSVSAAT